MKRKTHFTIIFCLAGMAAVLLVSCSTKKNTLVRRAYHNLTSRYNVYWNGGESFKEGVIELDKKVKDNYALILPVYNYGTKADAASLNQYMDVAIKKATKAIQKHSMVFNKKEHVRWIDDSYLLIGKSYFYKQDYSMARMTFEFVIKQYNDNAIKYDAMLWLAQTYIQQKEFKKAGPLLDVVLNKVEKGEIPSSYNKQIYPVFADYHIRQQNYTMAADYLRLSLQYKVPRKLNTRIRFILGQIEQQNGNLDAASGYYKQVMGRMTSYDMEFNASINQAQCFSASSGDSKWIIRKLSKRMLRDDKNKDFQDQIYFALAHIYMRGEDTVKAIEYLKKSVAKSTTNAYQKAISSLELAGFYLDVPDYSNAFAYFDSTMMFLPKDYPDYKILEKKTLTLKDLVTNLQIVSREDSLQRLAVMPEAQRNAIIDKIIEKIVEEEKKKQEEEQFKQETSILEQQTQLSRPPTGIGMGGAWYFYNPGAISNGNNSFVKRWGKRILEDNWFLQDKEYVPQFAEVPIDSVAVDSSGSEKNYSASNDPKNRNFYLKDIPFTSDLVDTSNKKIEQALFNLGFIYKEGLNDLVNSIASFESLLSRFPGTARTVQSYFQLYRLYGTVDNQLKSNAYRDSVLTRFPETDYAKLIIDPTYYLKLSDEKSQIEKLYTETYEAYKKSQYYIVMSNAGKALTAYPKDTTYLPRFEYLKALAIGRVEVQDSLIASLQKVILKYPKSPVKRLAQDVLDAVNRTSSGPGVSGPGKTDSLVVDTKIYSVNPFITHFYVLIVNSSLHSVDALKVKISDFNIKNYDLENLQISSIVLNNDHEMITVSNFKDADKALGYYQAIRA
ncbi:MAG: tetratricopeptide repeat protein, partial [Bacteroidetes bacterium]|nr:tetratricopeptide repeat protein [Bacteroidota bacterium]